MTSLLGTYLSLADGTLLGGFALLVYGGICCVLAIVSWKLYNGIKSRLWLSYSNLPTAPGLSVTNDHSTLPLSQPRGIIYSEWFAAKGKTLKIRVPPYLRPVILTADPAFASHVQRSVNEFEFSARMGVSFAKMGLHGCITCSLGGARLRVKRAFETAFSASAMRNYFPAILNKSIQERDKLMEGLHSSGGETIAIKARAEITRIMVDVVSKCYLGSDFDAIRTGEPSEMEVRVKKFYAFRAKVRWWDHYTITGYQKVVDMQRALRGILSYCESICEEKKSSLYHRAPGNEGKSGDILGSICRNNLASDLKPSQRLTDSELSHNVPPIVIGSTDVLALGTMFTLHCIATHPKVQRKLRKALSHLGHMPTLDEINRVPYFDNVIEEAMRLYQPYENIERTATEDSIVPLRYPVRGKDGQMMDSVVVTKGTEVRIAMKCLNADPELYGPDVEAFRPERFTDGSCSPYTEQMGFTWGRSSIFWGGGRGCPVFNYALASLKSIVFILVQSFEISEPEGQIVEMGGGGGPSSMVRINGQPLADIPMLLKPIHLVESKVAM